MNTQVETDKKGKKVAEHSWLDSNGTIVEDIEAATGIRYVDIASGQTFDYQVPGAVAGEAKTMQALFGCRTLSTNEASAERQRDGTGAEQVAAIADRFALFSEDPPRFVDRTREGGPRMDPNVVAQATVMVLAETKGSKLDGADDSAKNEAVQKLVAAYSDEKNGKALISKHMSNPAVGAYYKQLRGAKQATTDDLAAALG